MTPLKPIKILIRHILPEIAEFKILDMNPNSSCGFSYKLKKNHNPCSG